MGDSPPFSLRYLFPAHPQAMGKVLGIIYRAIFTHLIHEAGTGSKPNAKTEAAVRKQSPGYLQINARPKLAPHKSGSAHQKYVFGPHFTFYS